MAIAQPDHDVLIIGGGFSGIGVAIGLEKAGIRDYLIVEDGDGFGGTWHWNTYPGIAVDIPSFSYQFSFEKRADWSRIYAPGDGAAAYAEDCVDRHGLPAKARFGTRVTGAAFDEDAHAWTLDDARWRGDRRAPRDRRDRRPHQPEDARHPGRRRRSPARRSTPRAGTTRWTCAASAWR